MHCGWVGSAGSGVEEAWHALDELISCPRNFDLLRSINTPGLINCPHRTALLRAAVSREPHGWVGARPAGRPRRAAGAVQPQGPPRQQPAPGARCSGLDGLASTQTAKPAACHCSWHCSGCPTMHSHHLCVPLAKQVLLDTPAAQPRCYRVLVSAPQAAWGRLVVHAASRVLRRQLPSECVPKPYVCC